MQQQSHHKGLEILFFLSPSVQQQRSPQTNGNISFQMVYVHKTFLSTCISKCLKLTPSRVVISKTQTWRALFESQTGFYKDSTHNQCHKTFLKTDWEALGNFWQPLDKAKILLFQRIIPKNVISIRRWLEVCKEFCELLVNQDKFIKHNSQSPKFCFTLQYNSYIR